jgi:hypothetical protein
MPKKNPAEAGLRGHVELSRENLSKPSRDYDDRIARIASPITFLA